MKRAAADFIYKIISPFFSFTEQEIFTIGTKIPIPKFSEDIIVELSFKTTSILQTMGPVLELEPPIRIIGDIHGNLHDLLRIINPVLDQTDIKILLLGDYIDRGSYSLEVVIFLFTLLNKYTGRFFLLRGNHEFKGVCSQSGLLTDLKHSYNSTDLFDTLHDTFEWLPLAAKIGNDYLCLHGGLSPFLNFIEDIKLIPFPIKNYDDKLVSDILWSDPCKSILGFLDSTRGCGVLFGMNVIIKFLNNNNLKKIIRAHQCVSMGVESFNDLVITVFSSSFYRDDENRAGYLFIDNNSEIFENSLSPFLALKRINASFVDAPIRLMMKPIPGLLASRIPSPLQTAARMTVGYNNLQNKNRSRRSSSSATLALLPQKRKQIEIEIDFNKPQAVDV